VSRLVRVLSRLCLCHVELGLELGDPTFTLSRGLAMTALERIQARDKVDDHLSPCFRKRERLFPRGCEPRAPTEVQVQKCASEGCEGRDGGDDRGDNSGHPAQARDSGSSGSSRSSYGLRDPAQIALT
jgi:hypothetical protein